MATNKATRRAPLPSRREFLARGSALGMAATIGGTLAISRTAHAAGADETIKIALVGCGNRGSGAVAQALRTAGPVKLWAVADAFPDRIESSLDALEKVE